MRYIYGFLTIVAILAALYALPSQAASVAFDKLRATVRHIDMGSGSIVQGRSGTKYLLTNWHVCLPSESEGQIQASNESGESVRGKIVKVSEQSDLCAVAVDDQSLPALTLSPKAPTNSTQLSTRGYPNGVLSESTGRIKTPSLKYDYMFDIGSIGSCPQNFKEVYAPNSRRLRGCRATFENTLTTLYSRPGSSGSPVVNEDGNIVGVVESFMEGEGAGLVPYYKVKAFLEAL